MPTSPCRITGLVAAVLGSMVFAGCADAGTRQAIDPPVDAPVTFAGTGNGFWTTYAACEDEGHLAGSGSVTNGRLTLRVTDSNGTELLIRSFHGNFTLDPTTLNGYPGEWKMDTQRSGNELAGDQFAGDYRFNLAC